MTDLERTYDGVPFTMGEVLGLSRIMDEVATGRYRVGKTVLKRIYNKGRAEHIKSELDAVRDIVGQAEEIGEVTSVVAPMQIRKGTKRFIVEAIDTAIAYHSDFEEGPAPRDEDLGMAVEEINVLRGLSSALSIE